VWLRQTTTNQLSIKGEVEGEVEVGLEKAKDLNKKKIYIHDKNED
jgi:hypothetical protein